MRLPVCPEALVVSLGDAPSHLIENVLLNPLMTPVDGPRSDVRPPLAMLSDRSNFFRHTGIAIDAEAIANTQRFAQVMP